MVKGVKTRARDALERHRHFWKGQALNIGKLERFVADFDSENDERKFLITRDMPYGMTTRKGVFAGGDVSNAQATVVHAMQNAKRVAEGIAQYVDAVKLMEAIS